MVAKNAVSMGSHYHCVQSDHLCILLIIALPIIVPMYVFMCAPMCV